MNLGALRAIRGMTQQQIASHLCVNQAAVSRLERRTDMHISTLASLIDATGGRLELRAVFDDMQVRIDQASTSKPPGRRLKVRDFSDESEFLPFDEQ
jgi:transcriptional regulator with XRE-family HTH domain